MDGDTEAEPIAVIGMAGRFPAARDISEFWQNLIDGRDCVADLDDDDLMRRGELPELLAHPNYVRRRPRLTAADEFDAGCFGMTAREAEIHDPQFRLLLEVAHSALEHAGYDPAHHPGQIGVFAGTNVTNYRNDHLAASPDHARTVGFVALETGNAPDYAASIIAHRLGLRGPAMTLQAACATGLTAVHVASLSLRARDCDLALAGAASLELPLDYGYLYQDGSLYSREGVIRPFDADADGTVFGSGAGVVALKRLADAVADRDTIAAVIRGSGLTNDGDRSGSFAAPSVAGQAACIAEAIRRSGVQPSEISYVEAHATGTKVGDPIEIAGLAAAFRQTANEPLPNGACWIGSVKGSVGHLGQAAGLCGLIKTVLALQHEQIPPSIHVTRVNPLLGLEGTPFQVATSPVSWPRTPGRPRRAGVSAFGIGGANAHVVLEEAPAQVAPAHPEQSAPPRDSELVVWSGADAAAADHLQARLADHFAGLDSISFRDTAYTLRVGRSQRRHRAAVVAPDPVAASQLLRSGDSVIHPDGVERALVFCFPGQSAQHPGMGHRLYQTEPAFRAHLDEAFALAAPLLADDVRARWLAATDLAALTDTAVAQPLLYLVEYALARTLQDWGLRPAQVLGHSVGELVAATVAGVFDLPTGVQAVAARARLMQEMPGGRMLAVAASAEQVAKCRNGELPDGVSVAAINDARQCVLSGSQAALEEAAERLRSTGIRSQVLPVTHAFHSPTMAPAAEGFEAVLRKLPLRPPETALVSAATGEVVTPEQATDPSFWSRQLVEPVYFARAMTTVALAGPAFLVEVGPGSTLTGLLRGNPELRANRSVALPTLPVPDQPPSQTAGTLEHTLGRLWVEGYPVDLDRRDAHLAARRVPAPGYQYQRRRFWVERPPHRRPWRDTAGVVLPEPPGSTADSPPVAERPADPPPKAASWSLGTMDWVRHRDGRPPVAEQPVPGEVAALVLPPDPGLAGLVRSAFQQAGYRTVLATAGSGKRSAHSVGMVLDPDSLEDWDRLLERAGQSGRPAVVGYAGLLDAPESVDPASLAEQLDRAYFAVQAGARAAERAQRRRPGVVTVFVLTRGGVDVTGAERVNPATAMVQGLARSVDWEFPDLRCVIVDVAPGTPVEVLSGALAELAGQPDPPPAVALRGTATWLPVFREVAPNARPGRPRLRRDGVYLVTGGFGGIGLVVAQAMADTGLNPRIALLGRSGAPPPDTPRGAAVVAALSTITDTGADLALLSADVADPAALGEAVAEVERRFGPVNGVIHAAGVAGLGVPGGGLLAPAGPAEAERVFAAKVRGTLALDACFADRPGLDFMLICASHASITGVAGGADYAAANSFQDAFARHRSRTGAWTAAVAWPRWSEVGMVRESAETDTIEVDNQSAAVYRINPRDGAAAFMEVLNGTYPSLVFVLPPGPGEGGHGVPIAVRGMPWLPDNRSTPFVAPAPAAPPAPAAVPPESAVPVQPPAPAQVDGGLMAMLQILWAEAFGVEEVGIDDDFFDLGGNSLVSVQLSSRIRQQLRVELSAAALFHTSTIRQLAKDLEVAGST